MNINSLNSAKTNLFEDLRSALQSLDLFKTKYANVPILSDVIRKNYEQFRYYFMRTPYVEGHQIENHICSVYSFILTLKNQYSLDDMELKWVDEQYE